MVAAAEPVPPAGGLERSRQMAALLLATAAVAAPPNLVFFLTVRQPPALANRLLPSRTETSAERSSPLPASCLLSG